MKMDFLHQLILFALFFGCYGAFTRKRRRAGYFLLDVLFGTASYVLVRTLLHKEAWPEDLAVVALGGAVLLQGRRLPHLVLRFRAVLPVAIYFLLLEGSFAVLNGWSSSARDIRYTALKVPFPNATFIQRSQPLGYEPLADSIFLAQHRHENQTIYEATYAMDSAHRRVSPVPIGPRNEFAVFFGCSFTFGEGVETAETLPAQFQRLSDRHQSYNFGFLGYGPHQMLAKIESVPLADQIAQVSGDFFYVYMDDHPLRAAGSAFTLEGYGRYSPAYTWQNGTKQHLGSFAETSPLKTNFFALLFSTQVGSWLQHHWSPQSSDRDISLAAYLAKASQERLRESFPKSRFHVVIFPNSQATSFIRKVSGLGLSVIDLSQAIGDSSDFRIKGDNHPSALGYKKTAESLWEALEVRQLS